MGPENEENLKRSQSLKPTSPWWQCEKSLPRILKGSLSPTSQLCYKGAKDTTKIRRVGSSSKNNGPSQQTLVSNHGQKLYFGGGEVVAQCSALKTSVTNGSTSSLMYCELASMDWKRRDFGLKKNSSPTYCPQDIGLNQPNGIPMHHGLFDRCVWTSRGVSGGDVAWITPVHLATQPT